MLAHHLFMKSLLIYPTYNNRVMSWADKWMYKLGIKTQIENEGL